MTLLSHVGHRVPLDLLRRTARPAAPRPPIAVERTNTGERPDIDLRVFAVQRLGAVSVGLILLVFGLLGAVDGVGFLTTDGERYLGMSSNGLLSTLSLVVAAVLVGAAVRGPRPASTVMIVLGVVFLASALLNLAVLRTAFNPLAFRMSNVVFSVVVGLLLLVLGTYGRVSGHLPADSPYAHPRPVVVEPPDLPATPEEVAAEAAMREAEVAVVQHHSTEDQERRVHAMSRVRTREDRRRVWMRYDAPARADDASGTQRDAAGSPSPAAEGRS
jgi:hypothetical protein